MPQEMIGILLVSLWVYAFAMVLVLLPLLIVVVMTGSDFPSFNKVFSWVGWLGVGLTLMSIGEAIF